MKGRERLLEASGRVLPWRVGDRRSCPCGLRPIIAGVTWLRTLVYLPLDVLTTTTDMHNIHASRQFPYVATLDITRALQCSMTRRMRCLLMFCLCT